MTVTHVGSTEKYSTGWQNIFNRKKPTKTAAAKPVVKKKAAPKKRPKR